MKSAFVFWICTIYLGACSQASRERGDGGHGSIEEGDPSENGHDDSDSGNESARLDLGDGTGTGSNAGDEEGEDCGEEDLPHPNARLTGTVYAPNMEIPISGALVYLTDKPVEPIPDGVYCAECVELDCIHTAFTAADGTFELPAVAGGGQQLVVQKGQFLHVVEFDVREGDNEVPVEQSNLPGRWNPDEGQWIPRIAVYKTTPDEVFNVLAKFGLGDVDTNGALVAGTEQFDLIDAVSDAGSLIDDLDRMSRYHIIFVPCAASYQWPNAPVVPDARATNVQKFVASGGKWYVTDHANEYISAPFPMYQDFYNAVMPDIQPAYNSMGTVLDDEMLGWLEALPNELKDVGGGNPTLFDLPEVLLQLNYSGIDAVHEIWLEDDNGEEVNVGHYTWVEGPCSSCNPHDTQRPMAVSGQYGCGRMMYSTFENSSMPHRGLNPQELILLYMILEISVCFSDPPLDPPVE